MNARDVKEQKTWGHGESMRLHGRDGRDECERHGESNTRDRRANVMDS